MCHKGPIIVKMKSGLKWHTVRLSIWFLSCHLFVLIVITHLIYDLASLRKHEICNILDDQNKEGKLIVILQAPIRKDGVNLVCSN